MYNKSIAALVLTSGLVATPVFASNIFEKFTSAHLPQKNSTLLKAGSAPKIQKAVTNFADFSGTWTGTCTGYEGEETVEITNTDTEFDWGGMLFEIGSLETISTSNQYVTDFLHLMLKWNADHSSLLMSNSYVIHGNVEGIYDDVFGYGEGSISLKNGQLVIEFNSHTQMDNDNTVCTYTKQ